MKYEMPKISFEFPGYDIATNEQIHQYFDWRISTKEERIEYLSDYINNSGYKIELDYTIESFKPLWTWFEGIINEENIPIDWHEEWEKVMPQIYCKKTNGDPISKKPGIMNIRKFFGAIPKNIIVTKEQKLIIIGIIMDMGMYVGETLVRNFPEKLKWTVLTETKCCISSKRPIIKGEKEHDIFEPDLIISKLAARYFEYDKEKNLLFNHCVAWIIAKIDGDYYKKLNNSESLSYEIIDCPYKYNETESMSKKECNQYFQWFMDTRYERIAYLDNYIKSHGGIVNLDFTPESLKSLYKWYEPRTFFIKWSDEYWEKILESLPPLLRQGEKNKILNLEMERMSVDLDIYLGEVLIKQYPDKLYWQFVTQPRKSIYYHQIVIEHRMKDIFISTYTNKTIYRRAEYKDGYLRLYEKFLSIQEEVEENYLIT